MKIEERKSGEEIRKYQRENNQNIGGRRGGVSKRGGSDSGRRSGVALYSSRILSALYA